ncbi:MAG TPA: hypothetical protein V6C81_00160 [Planktothrix sp.]|jgi:hypothetical protein
MKHDISETDITNFADAGVNSLSLKAAATVVASPSSASLKASLHPTEHAIAVSPDLIRAKRAVEIALAESEAEVTRFVLNREWKLTKQALQNARMGGTSEDAERAIEEAKVKFEKCDHEMRRIGMPRYAKTTKALRNYAFAVLEYVAKLQPSEAENLMHHAVIEMEQRLMPRVDNLYMGVPGRMEALVRINLKQTFDARARLKTLERHLNERSLHIDNDQEARVKSVAANPIIAAVLERASEFPRDGAIFFLKGEQMIKGTTGSVPIMIDVPRLTLGLGKEGAGLFRFIGQEKEIDGACVIKLKLKNGKPIPLKGSDPACPKFAKEVCELIGTVPDWLKPEMTFGEVVKRFAQAPRVAARETQTTTEVNEDS